MTIEPVEEAACSHRWHRRALRDPAQLARDFEHLGLDEYACHAYRCRRCERICLVGPVEMPEADGG